MKMKKNKKLYIVTIQDSDITITYLIKAKNKIKARSKVMGKTITIKDIFRFKGNVLSLAPFYKSLSSPNRITSPAL